MAFEFGIGFSKEEEQETAAQYAALESKNRLNSDNIDFAIVFSTVDYDPQVTLPIIHHSLNRAAIIGCSSAGLIFSDSIQRMGISVLAFKSNDVQWGVGHIKDLRKMAPYQAGSFLANNSLDNYGQHGRQIFLFFIESLLAGNQQFIKGIQDVLGNVFPTVGLGSSDDYSYEKNFQLFNDQVLLHSASGLILGGHINVGIGNQHGWRPLGKPRFIDKAEGHIIKSISGYRASYLYEEYFEEEAQSIKTNEGGKMAILYPLGIYVEGNREYLLRNALSIEDDGSIVCQGDVPPESEVHLMIGNQETCKQAAFTAAQEALNDLLGREPKAVLVFSSFARLKLFGRTAFQEILEVKKVFGPDIPIFGMYSNGEISPLKAPEA